MRWIKMWIEEILHGTTFTELNAEERGVWFSLLVLAGDSPQEGVIFIRENVGYDAETLSKVINIPAKDITRAIAKLIEVGKIEADKNNILQINGWEKYQDNYTKYYKGKEYVKKSENKNNELVTKPTTQNRIDKEKNIPDESGIVAEPEKPKEPKPYIIKDDVGSVIVSYKMLRGFVREDRVWDKQYFSRYKRSAKQLLDIFNGNREEAIHYMQQRALLYEQKGLKEWTIDAVVRFAMEAERGETE